MDNGVPWLVFFAIMVVAVLADSATRSTSSGSD
jgi:hypothetical protein